MLPEIPPLRYQLKTSSGSAADCHLASQHIHYMWQSHLVRAVSFHRHKHIMCPKQINDFE